MRTLRATSAGKLSVVLAALVLLAGACGGGLSASAWAAAVCQALSPWRAEISTLTTRAQEQMTAETTPVQAKENLVRLLGGAHEASESARALVEKAGVPDVDDGEAVQRGFLRSLTAVRDAYGKALKGIEALDTGRTAAFYTGVREVMATLNAEYRASALDTSSLNSPELKQAFDEVPECR